MQMKIIKYSLIHFLFKLKMDKQTIGQYIDQLNEIPPEVQRILNQIRDKDRRILELSVELQEKREFLLERVSDSQEIRNNREKAKMKEVYEQIQKLQEAQIHLSKEKINLAEDLYNVIDEPTEILDREIANKYPDSNDSEGPKHRLGKAKKPKQENEWEYDSCEPAYCYCKRPSFGEMIMCENPLCEIEWFHWSCVEEKINRGDKWFCRECKKSQSKGRTKKEEKSKI